MIASRLTEAQRRVLLLIEERRGPLGVRDRKSLYRRGLVRLDFSRRTKDGDPWCAITDAGRAALKGVS